MIVTNIGPIHSSECNCVHTKHGSVLIYTTHTWNMQYMFVALAPCHAWLTMPLDNKTALWTVDGCYTAHTHYNMYIYIYNTHIYITYIYIYIYISIYIHIYIYILYIYIYILFIYIYIIIVCMCCVTSYRLWTMVVNGWSQGYLVAYACSHFASLRYLIRGAANWFAPLYLWRRGALVEGQNNHISCVENRQGPLYVQVW